MEGHELMSKLLARLECFPRLVELVGGLGFGVSGLGFRV